MGQVKMGLGDLVSNDNLTFIRRFRWIFEIKGVTNNINEPAFTANVLPPRKGARPSLSFKDLEVEHLSETIYYPGKAEWRPINLVLWEYKLTKNPVFEWIKTMYRPKPEGGKVWIPSVEGEGSNNSRFKRTATLSMLDGCGDIVEKWVFEHAYPQAINFGELDMGNSEVVTTEITLRYDRAYQEPL